MTPELQAEIDALYEQFLEVETPNEQDALLEELRDNYSEAAIVAVRRQLQALRKAEGWMDGQVEELGEELGETAFQNPHLEPNTRVDHFEIQSVIGEGGMGVVYEARDTRIADRRVALKMVSPGTMQSARQQALQRFHQEYRAAGRLEHDGFVSIYDVGTWREQPYIAMQFVDGPDLKSHQEQTDRCPQRKVADFVRKLSLAMHHAHLRGIVHRDLKPANILLSPFDTADEEPTVESENASDSQSDKLLSLSKLEPRITDFGIARDQDALPQPNSVATSVRVSAEEPGEFDPQALLPTESLAQAVTPSGNTRSDQFLGTVCYAAPEQIRGAVRPEPPEGPADVGEKIPPVTPQTDIYALGVILYELLTGTLPFPPESDNLFQDIVYTAPVRLRAHVNTIDRDLEAICLKCLSKKPGDRFQSASELAEELQRYLNNEPLQTRPPNPVHRFHLWLKRHPAIATAVSVFVMALVSMTVLSVRNSMTMQQKNAELAASNQVISKQNETLTANDTTIDKQLSVIDEQEQLIDDQNLKQQHNLRSLQLTADQLRLEQISFFQAQAKRELLETANVSALPGLAAGLKLTKVETEARYFRTRILNTVRRLPLMTQPLFHDHPVGTYGFNHTSEKVLTTSGKDALIWETNTGEQLSRFTHPDDLLAAEFSRNSEQVLTICWDNQLRVWTQGEDQPDWSHTIPQSILWGAKFNPEGTLVASLYYHAIPDAAENSPDTNTDSCEDPVDDSETQSDKSPAFFGHVYFHDTATGELRGSVRLDQLTYETKTAKGKFLRNYLSKVSFDPANPLVYLANGKEVLVYDLESRKFAPPANQMQMQGAITTIKCSRDGTSLAVGAANERFQMFETKTGLRRWHDYLVHPGIPVSFTFSDDGRQFYSTADGQTFLHTWDTYSGAAVPFNNSLTTDAITNATANVDGRMQLGIYSDHSVKIFDLASGFTALNALTPNLPVSAVYQSPSGRYVTFKGEQNRTYTFDLQEGKYLKTYRSVEPHYMADETTLLFPYSSVTSLDLTTGEVRKNRYQTEPPGQVALVTSTPDGNRVATLQAGEVNLFDAASDEHLGKVDHDGTVFKLQFSPDSQRLITVSVPPGTTGMTTQLYAVQIRDAKTLALLHDFRFPTEDMNYSYLGIQMTPHGKWVATHCTDSTIRVWNVETQELQCEIPTEEKVSLFEISEPGTHVAWVEGGSDVFLWDIAANQLHQWKFQHLDQVSAIQFDASGRFLATAAHNKVVQVWDIFSGQPITVPLTHDEIVTLLKFNETGTQLSTLTRNHKIRFWQVGDDPAWSNDELIKLCSFLSASTVQNKLGQPVSAEESITLWNAIKEKYHQSFTVNPFQVSGFHFRLQEVAQENEQWQLQLKHLKPLIEQLPDWPNYHYLAALAHHYSKEPAESKREFTEALRLAPERNDWRLLFAWTLWVNKDWEECVTQATLGLNDTEGLKPLNEAQRDEREARFREYRGTALASLGQFAEAEKDFAWLVINEPEEWKFLRSLALTFLVQNKVAEYRQLRKLLITNERYTNSEQRSVLANLTQVSILYPYETREVRGKVYTIALNSMRENAFAAPHLGRLAQAINSDKSLKQVQTFLEDHIRRANRPQDPGEPVAEYLGLAIVAHRFGNRLLALRNLQLAEELIARLNAQDEKLTWDTALEYRFLLEKTQQELEEFPDSSLIDSLLGYLPSTDDELVELVALSDIRLKEQPGDPLALKIRAESLAEQAMRTPEQTNWETITAAFQAARKQSPDSAVLWYYEALTLLKAGKTGEQAALCDEMLKKFLPLNQPRELLITLRACSLTKGTVPDDPVPTFQLILRVIPTLLNRDFDASLTFVSIGGYFFRCGEAADKPAERNQFLNYARSMLVPGHYRVQTAEKSRNHEVLRQVPLIVMLYTTLGTDVELEKWITVLKLWKDRLREPEYQNILPWHQRLEFELLVAQAEEQYEKFTAPVEPESSPEPKANPEPAAP